MKLRQFLCAAAAIMSIAGTANAAIEHVSISGSIGSVGAFSGTLNLDVTGGQISSGGGTINLLSYANAPITMITTSTPYNENNFSFAPVGFRANDGTDYYGLDTAYPIDANGLLFAVGTTTASFGANPLLAIYTNEDGSYGAQFTGMVDGKEYYNQSGSFTITTAAVPEPATWAMMIGGIGLAGGMMRRAHRKSEDRFTKRVREIAAA